MKAVGPNAQQADIALLKQILEAAGEGIVLVRSDTTIGYINKVGREILRYSRRDDPPLTCVELTALLGFDPLYIANEGKVVMIVAAEEAENVLNAMRRHPLGEECALIGEIVADHPGTVVLNTEVGGKRIVDMLSGAQLPRIC